MPDIAMCVNTLCPLRLLCFRYTARHSEYQSFADFKNNGDECDSFLPNYGLNNKFTTRKNEARWLNGQGKRFVSLWKNIEGERND